MKHLNTISAAALLSLALILPLATGCGSEPEAPVEETGENHSEENSETEAGETHVEGVVELSPEKIANAGITTAPVEQKILAPELETTGKVDYEQERLAHVSPRIAGRVQRVHAALGDSVDAGQTLATIDSVELGMARSAFVSAKAMESLARENYERESKLYEDRISSQKEMLEARAEYQKAVSERQSAQETLRLYGLDPNAIANLGDGSGGSSLLQVRSPISGRVVEKHVTLGELVSPSDVMFTVADLGHVWVWIDVFERDLSAVHIGDGVEVLTDAYPDRPFQGEVTYLSPDVDPESRTVRARIDVANPEGALRPGMFARIRLSDPHATGGRKALVVPAGAVVKAGEEQIVFVPAGEGRFEARDVETGRRVGDLIEILRGVEAGESVVVNGTFILKSELASEELGGGHGH